MLVTVTEPDLGQRDYQFHRILQCEHLLEVRPPSSAGADLRQPVAMGRAGPPEVLPLPALWVCGEVAVVGWGERVGRKFLLV